MLYGHIGMQEIQVWEHLPVVRSGLYFGEQLLLRQGLHFANVQTGELN